MTSLGIAAAVVYVAWMTYLSRQEYLELGYSKTVLSTSKMIEVVYSLFMLTLLLAASRYFLYTVVLISAVHTALGVYIEVFKPQEVMVREVMNQYWAYLAVDVSLSITCYIVLASQSTTGV